ncbi:MAG: phage head closure protein [Pseudomonadota bacterium]
MRDIRIGDLRDRVVIERVTLVDDGGGGVDETWVEVATVWAAVRALAGDERVEADAISGALTHEIHLRWRSDVGPDMRLRIAARVFDLKVVMDPDDRQKFLRCFGEERDL